MHNTKYKKKNYISPLKLSTYLHLFIFLIIWPATLVFWCLYSVGFDPLVCLRVSPCKNSTNDIIGPQINLQIRRWIVWRCTPWWARSVVQLTMCWRWTSVQGGGWRPRMDYHRNCVTTGCKESSVFKFFSWFI